MKNQSIKTHQKYSSLINKHNKHYKKFIQFSIKKGKKHTIENAYRKSLFHAAKKQKKFWTTVDSAIENTTTYLNVKTKRQGSKNIYIPIKIKNNYSQFLAYNWILKDLKKKSTSKFFNKFTNEIIDTAENKSSSSKKKVEIYKLIEENINNVWKK